jgi:hypothetical protein
MFFFLADVSWQTREARASSFPKTPSALGLETKSAPRRLCGSQIKAPCSIKAVIKSPESKAQGPHPWELLVRIVIKESNKWYRIVLRVKYRQRHLVFLGVPCVVWYGTWRGVLPTGGRVLTRSWDWPSPC